MSAPDGLTISVHVRPRASRTAVGGEHDGALVVAVTAAPTDGKANAAVERALADALGVRVADVAIVSGASARRKLVRISGATADTEARLAALAQGTADRPTSQT